ncbi:MAG: phosphoglycerate dehydrogenase [Bacteroidetes bacterium]|nr:phosphoglycerate dehydrogenase [Bacteroidota bacterium]
MPDNCKYVFDFDSTLTQVEALDILAEISLKNHPKKDELIQKIIDITNQGIDGTISFTEGLSQRLDVLNAREEHLPLLVKKLKAQISKSIFRNKSFFKEQSKNIYVMSAGFKEFIVPIVAELNIPAERVFANTFEFENGNIVGFDKMNPLSKHNGKIECLKNMNLKGTVFMIGDGYSDYVTRKAGIATKFFAYTENVSRKNILDVADHITPSFEEFLYLNKLPMAISYPKNRIKVLLLENIHPNAFNIFTEEGYTVETMKGALDEAELCKKIKDVHILGIRSKTNVTAKVLEHANKLMSVGAFCIGTKQIDLEACKEKGVVAFNAPFSNTRSVVELALGEIIMLMRRVFERSTELHAGKWNKTATGSYEIRNKTLGIVGYGNIGSQLSVVAEALGMKVVFYDAVEKLALGNAQKCNTLNELLKKSDVVSLHIDDSSENKNFFGDKEFKAMKDGAAFVNLSRGFVVDIASLVKHLKSGKISGAGVDVFPKEPKNNDEAFISELIGLPNVILTPHVGGSTQEAQVNIAEFVPARIIDYVNKGITYKSVNFPNIRLQEQGSSHRFLHVHENVPGIMAKVNGILSKQGLNIVGQYLKTDEKIGYLITDVDKNYKKELIEELKNIKHTIKFRVLY